MGIQEHKVRTKSDRLICAMDRLSENMENRAKIRLWDDPDFRMSAYFVLFIVVATLILGYFTVGQL